MPPLSTTIIFSCLCQSLGDIEGQNGRRFRKLASNPRNMIATTTTEMTSINTMYSRGPDPVEAELLLEFRGLGQKFEDGS